MNKAVEFLRNKTFYLATIRGGAPVMRPFGAVMGFENKLYFVTSKNKQVYKQIIENPNVCICACGENRQWVRINGVARADERKSAKQKMLDTNPVLIERKRFTNADDKTLVVFCVDDCTVEFN